MAYQFTTNISNIIYNTRRVLDYLGNAYKRSDYMNVKHQ